MKTYTDKITQKTITYKDDCYFTIETRSKFNSRVIKKIIKAEDIDTAFNEFYAMIIAEGHYKYLFMKPKHRSEPETMILRMKGYASKVSVENMVLKDKPRASKVSTVSIANLTKCPASLAHKLSSENYEEYPASTSRWTTSKVIYSLLAHLMTLSQDEKFELLMKADRDLIHFKELSGFDKNEENKIRVDVVTRDDLL